MKYQLSHFLLTAVIQCNLTTYWFTANEKVTIMLSEISGCCTAPGTPLAIYQVAELSGTAFLPASTIMNIISGFKQVGIFFFNRNIFPESAFLAVEISNQAVIADGQHENVTYFDHDEGVITVDNML